ncbi:hypothetical protein HX127_11180 [Acinetobacter sp. 256-1]|uniref:hypothetical protein n=1 Tax=Acinetobacter sp. 256-1 TaxID=2746721 RepID=UPI0025758316|nr:hypothetical protein [Acinetobacter sp. 256-1]MDM1758124.1 hypothetical protein [Acinetobacter sp. 256-1]
MSSDNEANYLFKKLHNLSGFESISIIFFISVGISLIYKYGYYSTLGIDWYINILTPQYLFMSSFMFLVFIFLGIAIGILLGLKGTEFFNSLWGQALSILLTLFIFLIYKIGVEVDFRVIVSFFSMIMVFLCIDAYQTTSNIHNNDSLLYKYVKVMRAFLLVFPLFSILCSPYFFGKKEAEILLSGKHNLNIVSLNSDPKKWLLLEMNGDKALLVNKSNFTNFKLIEYKDIKELNTP